MSGTEHAREWNPDTQGATISEWCAEHGVFRPLIPFSFMAIHPLKRLSSFRTYIDQLPPTCMTFAMRDVRRNIDHLNSEHCSDYGHRRSLMRLLGSWTWDELSSGNRYVNPNYVHKSSLPRPMFAEDDVAWTVEAARFGRFTLGDVAGQLNCSRKLLQINLEESGEKQWHELQAEGRGQMGRTFATLHEWGISYADVAAAVGMNPSTVRSWANKPLREGYEPPLEDPTGTDRIQVPGAYPPEVRR